MPNPPAVAVAVTAVTAVPRFTLTMLERFAGASLAAAVAFASVYWTALMSHKVFQVLALTVGSIVGVAVVAGILIYIPELVNGRRQQEHHRGRGRGRGRTRHRSSNNNSNSNSNNNNNHHRLTSSRSRERLNQNEYPASSSSSLSSTTIKLSSTATATATTSSRKNTPSLPPLPSRPRTTGNANYNPTTSRMQVSNAASRERSMSPRRYSSPPSLPSPTSLSQYCLNPIIERRLEDLQNYDDLWWKELGSRTQYYALILGYTQVTWDEDYDIDELPCEDWYWYEMTSEQKAAAQHFGYTKETWTD